LIEIYFIKMIKTILTITLSLFTLFGYAQTNMEKLETLIDLKDPAWPIVKKWIDSAKNKVEVLEVDSTKANNALYLSQYSTYSTIGAVIYNTGGILVDNGWIRILGSGSERLNRSVPEWNKDKTINDYGDKPEYLLIADDAVGGFFAINYGALGKDLKNVYYLAPNSLTWESLGAGYGEFMLFCFDSDLNQFYKGLRWSTWDKFISKLDGNKVYNFYPYLWTKEGKDIEKVTKKLMPVEEQWQFNIEKIKEKLKKD
jgi:Zn-finger protein